MPTHAMKELRLRATRAYSSEARPSTICTLQQQYVPSCPIYLYVMFRFIDFFHIFFSVLIMYKEGMVDVSLIRQ